MRCTISTLLFSGFLSTAIHVAFAGGLSVVISKLTNPQAFAQVFIMYFVLLCWRMKYVNNQFFASYFKDPQAMHKAMLTLIDEQKEKVNERQ